VKNKKRKRRRLKKSALFGLLFLIILFIAGSYITFNFLDDKDITKTYVKVNKTSYLYDKNAKKIGNVSEGAIFNVIGKDTGYYNIIGTDFYITSSDVSVIKYKVNDIHPNYIDIGKEITTKDNYNLINDEVKITLNKKNKYKIKYMDSDYYYINISNEYFRINKEEVSEVNDYKLDNNGSERISIIRFINISNSCEKYECFTVQNVEKLLNYVKEKGYYPITVADFKNWNNGNIRLKEKAVLLMSSEDSDFLKSINDKYNNAINIYTPESGFTYLNNNKTNSINTNLSSLNDYIVYKDSSLEEIGLMLKGESVNTKFFDGEVASSVPVLNYHFFYDLSKGQNNCNESICLEVSKFRKQLDYLRDNGYYTLTMDQFTKWIYGEIDVPLKSVLITIDDGAYGTGFHNNNNLIPILEEYKMHATLFLISGWWDINNYKSSYLEIQSHTNDMHNRGSCGEAQLICASYNEIMADLAISTQTIGNKETFCYPFYSYDNEAIKAIKDTGFKIAFGGGNVNATRNSNKYVVPRYPIHDSTTMDRFIKMVS